jgi:hypothetical protein
MIINNLKTKNSYKKLLYTSNCGIKISCHFATDMQSFIYPFVNLEFMNLDPLLHRRRRASPTYAVSLRI